SRVASSQMLAQLKSLGLNLSIKLSDLRMCHASVLLRGAEHGARFLIQAAVFFHVAVEAQQVAFIQFGPQNFPRAITHLANQEFLVGRIAVMEGHRLDAAVIAAADALSPQVVDATLLGQMLPVKRLTGHARTLIHTQSTEVLVVALIASRLVLRLTGL